MDQTSHPAAQRLLPVALLTLSGGLQDTYTYLRRGKVFANAQTGNIVLLGQSLFDGDWSRAARNNPEPSRFADRCRERVVCNPGHRALDHRIFNA